MSIEIHSHCGTMGQNVSDVNQSGTGDTTTFATNSGLPNGTRLVVRCWVCPTCTERRQARKRKVCNYGRSVTEQGLTRICVTCGLTVDTGSGCRNCLAREKNSLSDNNNPVLSNGFHRHAKGVVPVDTEDVVVQGEFVDAFVQGSRLDHVVQVLGYHPQYLESFLKTHQYLLRGDGPLPYDQRHYIAIMAAGRHQCAYLVHSQMNEFLLQGGDPRWLHGLEYATQKLRNLNEVNKLMAHRPWLITKAHITTLTRSSENNNNWSVSELMQALVLLAHFHALSSFTYGCGINPEIDHEDGHTFRPPSLSNSSTSTEDLRELSSSAGSASTTPSSAALESEGGGIGALISRMKQLENENEEMSQEELVKRFERVNAFNAELPAGSRHISPSATILRFVEDAELTYQDFARRGASSELPVFRAQDYSWDDHGFSLANRLYSDIGNLLDDKFKVAANLTYYTMGDTKDVDTSSFRAAIHYYIHSILGIRHDDYTYNAVNKLLERNLKAYIKTATCFPERVTRLDYEGFMREFKHSEKVHVNIMLLEARLQAELLYALRAFNQHLT